jgi:hypothetical protein
MVTDDRKIKIRAAMGFGFMAALFVAQPETWPVFLEWAKDREGELSISHEAAVELIDELFRGARTIDAMVAGEGP